jgi:hypothetical protein
MGRNATANKGGPLKKHAVTLTKKQSMAIAKLSWYARRAVDVEQRFDGRRTVTFARFHGSPMRYRVSQAGQVRQAGRVGGTS